MLKGKLVLWLAGAILLWTTAVSHATSISFSPISQDVLLGDQFTLDVFMDFSDDPTIGGGIDIFYDNSLLSFDSFVFDAGLGDDPAFRHTPDDLGGELDGLAFGNFNGLSGSGLVGTLTFTSIGLGFTSITLAENDSNWGSFYSAVTFLKQPVDFSATVNIELGGGAAPVPEPGTFLLFGTGLAGLVVIRKKKQL